MSAVDPKIAAAALDLLPDGKAVQAGFAAEARRLLGLLSDVGQSMQAHVDASDKLMQLLDDEDGSLAAALWQKPGAAPALDQVLQALVE